MRKLKLFIGFILLQLIFVSNSVYAQCIKCAEWRDKKKEISPKYDKDDTHEAHYFMWKYCICMSNCMDLTKVQSDFFRRRAEYYRKRSEE